MGASKQDAGSAIKMGDVEVAVARAIDYADRRGDNLLKVPPRGGWLLIVLIVHEQHTHMPAHFASFPFAASAPAPDLAFRSAGASQPVPPPQRMHRGAASALAVTHHQNRCVCT